MATLNKIRLAKGLALPLESVTETFAILANRGAGKSATARRFVEQLHHSGLPVVVLDVKGDWWGIRSSADGTGPGLPFVIFGGDHGDVPLEPTAGELLADLIVDDRVPAVLDLSHMSKTKARTFATTFAERLYSRNRDPLHVVIEEADVLVPQRASADTARLLGAMEDIAKRGRSRGIGLTIVSQRGQDVSKSVLELMETVVLLRMTGPRTIKAAQDWVSVNADTNAANKDVIPSLPTLQVGHAWVWSPAFLRLLKRVQIEKFETFDSHATPRPDQPRVVPKHRADIDLDKLGAEIAATAERAREHDPRTLQARVTALQHQLEQATSTAQHWRSEATTAANAAAELQSRLDTITETLIPLVRSASTLLSAGSFTQSDTHQAAAAPRPLPADPRTSDAVTTPTPLAANTATQDPSAPPTTTAEKFPAGAQRMLTSLARMAPLRVTKAQWGTVAMIKHTSGTWSTYLTKLRRAGFIDENPAGFTLTSAGFDYLGGRPEPLTADELQQHYLSILPAGAARMLRAIMDASPRSISREQLGIDAGIASSSGTFTTYLSTLRRNGLIESHAGTISATKILMHGSRQ